MNISYLARGREGEGEVEKSYLTRCVIFRSMDFERPDIASVNFNFTLVID